LELVRIAGRHPVERILARLRTKSDDFYGVFGPEQTAMLKRVFLQICQVAGIEGEDQDRRETLALVIVRATKISTTEPKLIALARKTAKTS
jgi:hypothetical protein